MIMNKIKTRYIISFVVFILFWIIIYRGMDSVDSAGQDLGVKALSDALTRSLTHSYATTGAYPTSIEEVQERYGIQIDENKYIVHYEAFASNIMPDISIIPYSGNS